MSDSILRQRLIRLAHKRPELRGDLLPLIKESKTFMRQFERANKLDGVDPSVAQLLLISGHDDGSKADDKIAVRKASISAEKLKPSQTSMVLGKSLGMALLMMKTGKVGGELGALISRDNFIMDGHHRWSATILAGGGNVGGYQASLPGPQLLRVLNLISKGRFRVRGGKPGKGSLAAYTEANVRKMITDFVNNGIKGEFPWSPQDVQDALIKKYGDVELGIDATAKQANKMVTSAPSWAPDRKQMPVIEPHQVPQAVKLMDSGIIDWAEPHKQG